MRFCENMQCLLERISRTPHPAPNCRGHLGILYLFLVGYRSLVRACPLADLALLPLQSYFSLRSLSSLFPCSPFAPPLGCGTPVSVYLFLWSNQTVLFNLFQPFPVDNLLKVCTFWPLSLFNYRAASWLQPLLIGHCFHSVPAHFFVLPLGCSHP